MASDSQLTPMMAQYRRIKSELPKDALLLFRLGDFYEMFFEDAQIGAQLLNVALTKRGVTQRLEGEWMVLPLGERGIGRKSFSGNDGFTTCVRG